MTPEVADVTLLAVTMPVVVTDNPTSGELNNSPWISAMVFVTACAEAFV